MKNYILIGLVLVIILIGGLFILINRTEKPPLQIPPITEPDSQEKDCVEEGGLISILYDGPNYGSDCCEGLTKSN